MDKFKRVSPYAPMGDQPEAIDTLVNGIENGIEDIRLCTLFFALQRFRLLR